jgi:mannose-6-phosphate isomerase-like protein (cupin superfamily)
MRTTSYVALLSLSTLLSASPALTQTPQPAFLRVTPEAVKWVKDTDGSGVERATIHGDPSKQGIYVVRIKFPPGVMSLNHYHQEDRHAVVLKGTWHTGTGDAFDPSKTVALTPGSYMMHPAGAHHFDGAKDEEVILQIIGYGPTSTVRLRPEEGNYRRISR